MGGDCTADQKDRQLGFTPPLSLPLHRFPVVLAAAPRQRAPARPGEAPPPLQQSPLPILAFMLAAQSGGGRGRSYYPYVGLRAPLALQVRALGALGVRFWCTLCMHFVGHWWEGAADGCAVSTSIGAGMRVCLEGCMHDDPEWRSSAKAALCMRTWFGALSCDLDVSEVTTYGRLNIVARTPLF